MNGPDHLRTLGLRPYDFQHLLPPRRRLERIVHATVLPVVWVEPRVTPVYDACDAHAVGADHDILRDEVTVSESDRGWPLEASQPLLGLRRGHGNAARIEDLEISEEIVVVRERAGGLQPWVDHECTECISGDRPDGAGGSREAPDVVNDGA